MKNFSSLLLFLLWLTGTSLAQNTQQTIRGTIVDTDSKLPVQGVTIQIELNNNKLTSITDAQGNFRFEALTIGRYTLSASSIGYDRLVLPNLVL
ncbi:MAG: carboxypeptidase-like regulatory domain-containing protein, partial [Flavihumibacter sp.]|nr:carboxypeptidase-like regulatory domain-containing protein [Flavihumibacter sp.]